MNLDADLSRSGRAIAASTADSSVTAARLRTRRRRARALLGTGLVATVLIGGTGFALTRSEEQTTVVDRADETPPPPIVAGSGPTTVVAADGQVLGVLPTGPTQPAGDPVTDRVMTELLDDPVLAARLSEAGVTGERAARAALLSDAGLRVETAIRPAALDAAESSVASAGAGARSALVSLDPASGEIVALAGPVTTVDSQVGSAFLPITMAAALEGGVGVDERISAPAELVVDRWETPWSVQNFGGADLGEVTLAEALASSAVTPWVALFDQGRLDPDTVADLAGRLGIPSDHDGPAVPAVVLGVDRVQPVELAGAYAAFATAGRAVDAHAVTRVLDGNGEVVYDAAVRPVPPGPALEPSVAVTVREAMAQAMCCGANGTASLGDDVVQFGHGGTVFNGVVAWYAGSTPALTTVAWTGYDEGAPVDGPLLTANDAAPVWNAYMRAVTAATPNGESFPS